MSALEKLHIFLLEKHDLRQFLIYPYLFYEGHLLTFSFTRASNISGKLG